MYSGRSNIKYFHTSLSFNRNKGSHQWDIWVLISVPARVDYFVVFYGPAKFNLPLHTCTMYIVCSHKAILSYVLLLPDLSLFVSFLMLSASFAPSVESLRVYQHPEVYCCGIKLTSASVALVLHLMGVLLSAFILTTTVVVLPAQWVSPRLLLWELVSALHMTKQPPIPCPVE